MSLASVSLAAVLWCGSAAEAVVVYGTGPADTDNALNTTAPANGAPWANVVRFGANNASGVYVGHGYVLTAQHVGDENNGIVINGVSYDRDLSFPVLQVTEDHPGTPYADVVDLKLVKILGNPGLPALPVVQKLPLAEFAASDENATCTMMGWGMGKGAVIADQGWGWGGDGTRAQRWATNVTLGAMEVAYSGFRYDALLTLFDRSLGSNTGQLTLGDSGGALFQLFGGTWKLSGVITAVLAHQSSAALYDGQFPTPVGDQPDGSSYVRLSRYGHLLRYENWAAMKLGNAAAAETGDEDADGVTNLLEYAFHTDPVSAASGAWPVAGREPGFFTLTYSKFMSATDLRYEVEETDQLVAANWQPVVVEEEIISNSGLLWTVKAKVPVGSETSRFYRLRVTRLP
jgi:hypothetical protein